MSSLLSITIPGCKIYRILAQIFLLARIYGGKLKIITWNVNGLRAVLGKGAIEWLSAQDVDAICLQEVKARPDQLGEGDLTRLSEYLPFWNPAQRPGYSGVLTFSRHPPLEVRLGFGVEEFDGEGRLIALRYPEFWLFNIYFPNGQRDGGRLDFKLRFYAELLEQCDRMHAAGERIILTGDFNTAHREIDLRNPKQNVETSGFMPVERAWIDRYLEHRFVDVYRHLYPERVQYTWWTYRLNARQRGIGWRLDYYLVSAGLLPLVQDVIINDAVLGSDHCPVTLLIAG
jgi:exodeoxyribonuclease-3